MKKVISFCLYQAPKYWEQVMETNYKKYLEGFEEIFNLAQKYKKSAFKESVRRA